MCRGHVFAATGERAKRRERNGVPRQALKANGDSPRLHQKKDFRKKVLFQLNPPVRVGEMLLRNVKFSLRSSEIAAAMGGFNFT